MGIVTHVTQKIKDLEKVGMKISDIKMGEGESSFRSVDSQGRIRKHTFRPKLTRIEAEGEVEAPEQSEATPNAPVKRGRGRPKKRV